MTQGEQAYNIGRIAVLLSQKLPDTVTGSTIARYCASSLNAIRIGADSIRAGDTDVYIAAGVESVTRAGPNSEATLPDTQNPKLQGKDGTHNAYISMGETAENVAERYGVTREQQDEYAKRSQDLAVASQESGFFDKRDHPGRAARRHDRREGRRPARRHDASRSSAELKPVFREGGTVTAGNACPLNDGAAAVLLMSDGPRQGARPQAARPRHRRRPPAATSRSTWASPRSARSRTC